MLGGCSDRIARPPARTPTLYAAILGVAALFLALLAAGGAGATQPADYGDAPDTSPTGYPAQVLGLFPAVNSSNGPRHTKAGQLVLGAQVDRERDSRQVNRDRFDDGFSAQLTRCAESTLRFTIDATKLPAALKTPGHVAVLNAWFDFDRSGEWKGSSPCPSGRAAEHAVRNQAVPLESFAATPVQTIEVKITAGQQVRGIWQRASLTLDERFASSASTGRFQHGETEDYGPAKKRIGPTPKTLCNPLRQTGFHGDVIRATFEHRGRPPKEIELVGKAPDGWRVRIDQNDDGVSVRARKDGPKRTETRTLTLEALRVIGRGKGRKDFKCTITIKHEKKGGGGVETPGGGTFPCTPVATFLGNEGQFGADAINRYRLLIRCNQRLDSGSTLNTKNLITGIASIAPCQPAQQRRSGRSLGCVDNTVRKQIAFEFAIIEHDPAEFMIQAQSRNRERIRDVVRPAP